MGTAVLIVVLVAAVVFGVKSYMKKLSSGCCGTSVEKEKRLARGIRMRRIILMHMKSPWRVCIAATVPRALKTHSMGRRRACWHGRMFRMRVLPCVQKSLWRKAGFAKLLRLRGIGLYGLKQQKKKEKLLTKTVR